MSPKDLKAILAQKPAGKKYRNEGCEVDGIRFDSLHEAGVWVKLQAMQRTGLIRNLQRQVSYRITVGGALICTYRADFTYDEKSGPDWKFVVADAKGYKTSEYKLKKKLMLEVHGIEIKEF